MCLRDDVWRVDSRPVTSGGMPISGGTDLFRMQVLWKSIQLSFTMAEGHRTLLKIYVHTR